MILLSPFLTVLCKEAGTGTVIHAPFTDRQAIAADLDLDIPAGAGAPVPVPGLPGITAEAGERPRCVHLCRDARDLCVHPEQTTAFLRDRQAGRFDFLLLHQAELTILRHIAAHTWHCGGCEITLAPTPPYALDAGAFTIDLCTQMPRPAPDTPGGLLLDTPDGPLLITPVGIARDDMKLAYRPEHCALPVTHTAEAFRQRSDCRLAVTAGDEILTLPLTACDADTAWFYDKPYGGSAPLTGRHRFRPLVVRQSRPWVMMARWVEGVVFDEHGVSNEIGYVDGLCGEGRHLPLAAGMRREGNRMFLDRALMAEAPFVPGPHIVFYGGTLPNYAHWLIDAMLPLHLLLAHTPPGTRLLMPATLRNFAGGPIRICDHYDIMRAFGFGSLPMTEITAPYCRVEEVYWLEDGFIHNMPAEQIRGLRNRAMALRLPPPPAARRLFIARRINRRVANVAALAPFLSNQGFSTHVLEDLSIDEQIDLFASAEFVIGVHGAELGNLLFCQPGAKVLELAPDYDYKPYFSIMCNKLGLSHGVLPCATADGLFSGDLNVDVRKFGALFRMLKNRL